MFGSLLRNRQRPVLRRTRVARLLRAPFDAPRRMACHEQAPRSGARRMVEAVGVEPTSFAQVTGAPTCLFHLWVSPAGLPMARPSVAPALMVEFRPPARRRNRQTNLLSSSRPTSRCRGRDVADQLSRECQLFVGSYLVCPVFNEAAGQPRHAAHVHSAESKPFRPRGIDSSPTV